MTNRSLLGVAVSLATLSAASAAFAQAAATPAANQNPTRLQEVVVTAERRSENLQKVPLAVTSFSANSLAIQQIDAGVDLGRLVPNMFAANNVGQGSANVYYVRGLGQTQSFPTFEPQVGLYVDDIYVARVNANNFNLFGASQVQVLNGPQGTLFGRNSTGGAILVTLQKPGQIFGGDADLSYGSWNRFSGHGSVDIPLSDQILTRTSAYFIHDDGWVQDVTTHQTLNATKNYGVREAVTLKPSGMSNIQWDLSADYEHNNSANLLNQPSASGGANGTDRISYSGFTTEGGALAPFLTGDKRNYGQGVLVRSWGATSNIKASFGAGTLNFITGFRGLDQHTGADFALGTFPLIPFDTVPTGMIALAQSFRSTEYTQEIKWNGDVGDRLNYTIGAFYLYESNRNNYGQVLNLLGIAGPFALNDQFVKNDTSSIAAYAQGDYKITSQLTLTLGGRYTHEVKRAWAMPNNGPGSGYTTAQINAAGNSTHLDASEFTPRIVLSYQVDPDLMVFASATRGFQGGGWNGLTGANPIDFNAFGPETMWSFETGFRAETPDRRLRINATAFYEDVKHAQLLYDNPFTDSFDTANAANMRGYGVEARSEWEPVDNLNLTANLSGIKAEYYDPIAIVQQQQAACLLAPGPLNANCDHGIITQAGALAVPVYTPPFTATLMGSYTFNFDSFTVTPTVAVQFTAREWFDTANSPGTSSSWPAPAGGQDAARTLLDLGVTFAPRRLPFSITAECKNCTMVNYGTADLLALDYFNTPGQWDVRVDVKF